MTKDEALQMCLEYIETNVATAYFEALGAERRHVRWAIKDALAQPDERNFCQSCGKRTADPTIHTCTSPQTIADEHIAKVTSDINLAVYKALAQPEQEPVGSVVRWVDGSLIHAWFGDPPPEGTFLYITPPR